MRDAWGSGARRKSHPGDRLRRWGPVAAVVAAMLLGGCDRLQGDFRGDTDGGRIQLDVERVAGASIDDVTKLRLRERERAYERIFTARLPARAQVTVSASVAKLGMYRRGGSWVFMGRRMFGRHGVWARTLEATSSDPDCVAVTVEPALDGPAHNRVVLRGARSCSAQISLSVQPLDTAGRPVTGERVSDTVTITVDAAAS